MTRKYNFCAGPAALPEAVLKQAQQELLDWQSAGCSIMEMSHRSPEFVAVAENPAKDDVPEPGEMRAQDTEARGRPGRQPGMPRRRPFRSGSDVMGKRLR